MAEKILDRILSAAAASNGGVVRRKLTNITKIVPFDEIAQEVRRRNFHLIQTGGQLVFICNSGKLQIHV